MDLEQITVDVGVMTDVLGVSEQFVGRLVKDGVVITVVLAAKGYPAKPETGSIIRDVEKAEALDEVLVFHAGTKLKNGDLVANGGRVLNVVALGKTVGEAQKRAYEAVDKIDWPGGFCRRDIGWQAIKREQG